MDGVRALRTATGHGDHDRAEYSAGCCQGTDSAATATSLRLHSRNYVWYQETLKARTLVSVGTAFEMVTPIKVEPGERDTDEAKVCVQFGRDSSLARADINGWLCLCCSRAPWARGSLLIRGARTFPSRPPLYRLLGYATPTPRAQSGCAPLDEQQLVLMVSNPPPLPLSPPRPLRRSTPPLQSDQSDAGTSPRQERDQYLLAVRSARTKAQEAGKPFDEVNTGIHSSYHFPSRPTTVSGRHRLRGPSTRRDRGVTIVHLSSIFTCNPYSRYHVFGPCSDHVQADV